MNTLAEKIKSIFNHREKLETGDPQKDRLNDALWGANDIARSIQESIRFQTQRNLWHRIFD